MQYRGSRRKRGGFRSTRRGKSRRIRKYGVGRGGVIL